MNLLLIIIIILVFIILGLFGYVCALRVLLKSAHESTIANEKRLEVVNDKLKLVNRNNLKLESIVEFYKSVNSADINPPTYHYKRVIKCASNHNPLDELPSITNPITPNKVDAAISHVMSVTSIPLPDALKDKYQPMYHPDLDSDLETKERHDKIHTLFNQFNNFDGVDANEAPKGFIAISSAPFRNIDECSACQAQDLCLNELNWALNNPCVATNSKDIDGNSMPARKDKRDVIFLRKD